MSTPVVERVQPYGLSVGTRAALELPTGASGEDA